jgi:hypothetical protein
MICFTFTQIKQHFSLCFGMKLIESLSIVSLYLEREVRPVMQHPLHYWVQKLPNFGKLTISTPILEPNLPEPLQ